MSTETSLRRPRPYWHVDAKWITGLLLLFVLSITLVVYQFYRISAREPATEIISQALSAGLSFLGGFTPDDPVLLEQLQQRLAVNPGQPVEVIPGLAITLSPEQLTGLTPRAALRLITDQLAAPIYAHGAQGLANLTQDAEMRQSILAGGDLFDLLTADTHASLEQPLKILAGVSGALLLGLILFSRGFGRIGSPGCVLFVVGLPGLALWAVWRGMTERTPVLPDRVAGAFDLTGYILANALPSALRTMTQNYLLVIVIGLGLLTLAFLGTLIRRVARR